MKSVRRAAALKVFWQTMRGSRAAGAPTAGARLGAVPRMVAQGMRGTYPHLDRGRILVALLGLVYVLSPVDAIPEIIVPILGFGDDAVVAAFVFGSLLSEADAFLEWEAEKSRTVAGQVIG
ncbi:YkvA family protein [Kineosporia sp. R_H_3]|uniref:YkvA family protein n=1 Tax=Kineosporia sp. R_H_3 TaxID=1961848 RepID=UPI000B4C0F0F|nr:DUF1232 domain-containing protein [Kineosporia sp. R_H_3]